MIEFWVPDESRTAFDAALYRRGLASAVQARIGGYFRIGVECDAAVAQELLVEHRTVELYP